MPLALIARQLDISVSFAEHSVFPRVTPATAHFAAVPQNAADLRPDAATGHWTVDWPDEDSTPPSVPTPAWLLWHITWWWTSAEEWAHGRAGGPPDASHRVDTEAGIARIRALSVTWHRILAAGHADQPTAAPFPTGETLGGLAAWVDFELAKNLAELSMLLTIAENAQHATSADHLVS